jgi:hypothetical protein
MDLQRNFQKLFEYLCQQGETEKAQDLHHFFSNEIVVDFFVLHKVCKSGHIDTAKWLYNDFLGLAATDDDDDGFLFYERRNIVLCSCEHGHTELALWFLEQLLEVQISVAATAGISEACLHGHLETAQVIYFVYRQFVSVDDHHHEMFVKMAKGRFPNNIDCMKWVYSLHSTQCAVNTFQQAFEFACSYGSLAVAQWLCEMCPELTFSTKTMNAFVNACSCGHVDTAMWMFDKFGTEMQQRTTNYVTGMQMAFRGACVKGCLDLAKWLAELSGNVYTETVCAYVLRYCSGMGRLHVIQWLVEVCPSLMQGHHLYTAMEESCRRNEVDVVDWLIPLLDNETIGFYADGIVAGISFHGNLALGQRLLEAFPSLLANPSIAQRTYAYACFYSMSREYVEWLHTNAAHFDIMHDDCEAFRLACKNNSLEVAEYLLSQCPQVLDGFCGNRSLELFLEDIAFFGELTTLKWIYAVFPPERLAKATDKAFAKLCTFNKKRLEKVVFLASIYPTRYHIVLDKTKRALAAWKILKPLPMATEPCRIKRQYFAPDAAAGADTNKKTRTADEDDNGDDVGCLICYDETSVNCLLQTNCGHFVCNPCAMRWYNFSSSTFSMNATGNENACPYCRTEVTCFKNVEFML